MRWILFLCLASRVFGTVTVEGRIIDGSSGGPGTADRIQLILLSQTMQPVASQENATGSYRLTFDGDATGATFLVQATKGRSIYSERVTSPGTALDITVYDNREDVEIDASLGTLAFYAVADTIDVGLFYNLDNNSEPPVTLDRADATFSFPLSPGYRDIEASTRRGNMPLRQNLSVENGLAALSYPLKPGRTQLMVRTIHDYASPKGAEFTISLPENQEFLHVLVLPQSLNLEAPGLEFVSNDDSQNLKLYEWKRQPGQSALTVSISGESSATREPATTTAPNDATHGAEANFQALPSPANRYRWWIVGSASGMLLALTLWGLRRH